jgi:hypothetical protein
VSFPSRTADVADHGSVTCAIVVESGESARLRDEVRKIIGRKPFTCPWVDRVHVLDGG